MIIGLCFVSMAGIVASALDYSRGGLLRSELVSALDAAALAGGTVANSPNLNPMINKYFNVNMPASYMGATVDPVTITQAADKTTLTVSASAHLKNAMMQIVNWNMTNVGATSEVTIERKGMEVGSMMTIDAGNTVTRMAALKSAATDLVNILFGNKTDSGGTFWIGLVPFSQAVNIGSGRADWTSGSPNYYTSGVTHAPSVPLSWKGCVEAREASNRDVTDDPPSTALFPKYYSPCVSNPAWVDTTNGRWYNSWFGTTNPTLSGSTTPAVTIRANGTSNPPANCVMNSSTFFTSPLDTVVANTVSGTTSYYNWGPNQYCPQAVTPMTSDKATIINGINSMIAIGDTQTNIGLVWGWRMLSPSWRSKADGSSWWGGVMAGDQFSDPPKPKLPLDYNTPLMNKVIILLSDGNNSFVGNNYTAYGQLDDGRLGTTNGTTAVNTLNSRTTALCTTLKASNKNILIYTVALGGTITTAGKNLLKGCASKPEYYFESPDGTDLQEAFHVIGDSLSNLRISH